MDEGGAALVREDGPERPGNGDAGREVTFRRGERVRRGCSLKEEPALQLSEILMAQSRGRSHSQAQKDKDLGPDTCPVSNGIDAERLKGGQDHENSRPSVVQ